MELRLFPLAHVVLFPGMLLPLQVFEPRYRQLVVECLQANEPFGVALIRDGVEVGGPAVPYEVGTTARITSANLGPDGTLHLATVGERRFRMLALHDDRPYLWADVEYLSDESLDVPADLAEQARFGLLRLRRLQATAAGEFERDPRLPRDPGELADVIASLLAVPPEESQQFLETLDPQVRLEAVIPPLEELLAETARITESAAAMRWRRFGSVN